jgi:hypothetical protein
MGSPSYRLPCCEILAILQLLLVYYMYYKYTTRELSSCKWSAGLCFPSVISVMSEFCVLIQAAATAGIARSSQMSSSLAGQAVKVKAGVRHIYHSANHTPPSPRLHLGRAGRRVGSILYGLRSLCHCNQKWRPRSLLHWTMYSRSTFLGPNGTRFARCPFRAQKSLDFQGPRLPMVW